MTPWIRYLPRTCRPRDDLRARGSLSARLAARFSRFLVRPLTQFRGRALPGEGRLIGQPGGRGVRVREVLLQDGETPLVFAHSVTAARHVNGPWRALRGLGRQPLAALLFADRQVIRRPLRFARVRAADPLGKRLRRALPTPRFPLWARRSVFIRRCAPLLVTEVFLDGVGDRTR